MYAYIYIYEYIQQRYWYIVQWYRTIKIVHNKTRCKAEGIAKGALVLN